jgi:hypothetical protein
MTLGKKLGKKLGKMTLGIMGLFATPSIIDTLHK